MSFRQMEPEEQTRHQAASGELIGTLQQLRFSQRSPYYREVACCIMWSIAYLAEQEARALEG
jgi:hypothetical protein